MAKLRQVFYPAKFSPFFQLYNFEPLFPTLKSWITHHQEWMPMVVGSRFFTTASAAAEVAAGGRRKPDPMPYHRGDGDIKRKKHRESTSGIGLDPGVKHMMPSMPNMHSQHNHAQSAFPPFIDLMRKRTRFCVMEVDRHDDSIRIGESRLPKLLQIGLIRNYGNP
jgi:hypothetical protein